MKVKEIHRTANIAFSPPKHQPILLASGTAAQQLDATFRYALTLCARDLVGITRAAMLCWQFSTTAALEIFALDPAESGLETSLKASIAVQQRSDYAYGLGSC